MPMGWVLAIYAGMVSADSSPATRSGFTLELSSGLTHSAGGPANLDRFGPAPMSLSIGGFIREDVAPGCDDDACC